MTHADWTGKGSLLAVGAALLMGGQDATAQSKLGETAAQPHRSYFP